ncbi:MAG TPA: glycoside hydrolase family 15 protein [Nocardioidaceae bacterium]|nr:glycoside hydrolase family 15 protein [Nocardioidaceae bacterium]
MSGTRAVFPRIGDYAFLSDCETTALVAPSGNVEWMCPPRADGPSVFGALLDRVAGRFGLSPARQTVPSGRRYIPGTNVLETTWQTATGWLVVTDALCIGPWRHVDRRSDYHLRVPSDHEAEGVLLRRVRCVSGRVDILLNCLPVFDYGRVGASWSYNGPGYGDAVATGEGVDLRLRLTTDMRLGLEGNRAVARTALHEGEEAFAALSWSDRAPTTCDEAGVWMDRTVEYWREWLSRGRFPDHPWGEYLRRSALCLKGLTYAPTGALLAASTTSLPEAIGGNRNWDYRFTWIRDSTFMLKALHELGFTAEAFDYFGFVGSLLADKSDLQVMYGIDGERKLDESTLDHLSGYEGARPVRVGNGAYTHRQNDVWGAALDSIHLHTRFADNLPKRAWTIVDQLVEAALSHWEEPDRGIWEVRGEPQHFTSSKVMCWVAADRGADLARLRGEVETAERWEKAAAQIKDDICTHGVDERGVLVQRYGASALDASALLAVLVGFLPPDDPRIVATVLAIADELTEHGLVLRYRVDETDDGLTGKEGTFLICSFWLAAALADIGELVRARELLEKLLTLSGPMDLYAEEIEASSGRHLGNFPQAFTHLSLVHAVQRLLAAEAHSLGQH